MHHYIIPTSPSVSYILPTMAQDLLAYNTEMESTGKLSNYDHVFHQFLWGSNPFETYHPDILYNRNHLLGLLICRHCCNGNPPESLELTADRFILSEIPPHKMTLKQIKDTFANIQFEWPLFLLNAPNQHSIQAIKWLREACISRVGEFLTKPMSEQILNDTQDTQPYLQSTDKILTPSATRRLLGSILLIHRHIYLYENCEEVELAPNTHCDTGVTMYHHEASTEQFHKLCMHYSLPIAGKLHYKHDFPGMYNDVSQAVFFHDNNYKRLNREPHTTTLPLHLLPSVSLLYPEIPVKFEDDLFDPTQPDRGWYWILLPQRIYLVSPEPQIYYSDNLSVLVKLYMDCL
jgi:hypothetical protein